MTAMVVVELVTQFGKAAGRVRVQRQRTLELQHQRQRELEEDARLFLVDWLDKLTASPFA
jgi:hypothetical protein